MSTGFYEIHEMYATVIYSLTIIYTITSYLKSLHVK